MKNSKGQSLIETLLILPTLMLTLTVLSLLCYRTVIYYYSDFYLHESLLCTNEKSNSECSDQLEKQINKILFKKNSNRSNVQTKIKKERNSISGQIEIQFSSLPAIFNIPMVLEKKISLPIQKKT
jgi:hypothetical protein